MKFQIHMNIFHMNKQEKFFFFFKDYFSKLRFMGKFSILVTVDV